MERIDDAGGEAEHPAQLSLSPSKYRRMRGLGGLLLELVLRWKGLHLRELTRQHLRHGDTRAALVVNTTPLVVSSYSDEIDAVVLHRFPSWVLKAHQLTHDSRLLAVFYYQVGDRVAPDLEEGPASTRRWANVCPLIAEFLSDDTARIAARKREIDAAEWVRCRELAAGWRRRHGLRTRRGGIIFNGWPIEPK